MVKEDIGKTFQRHDITGSVHQSRQDNGSAVLNAVEADIWNVHGVMGPGNNISKEKNSAEYLPLRSTRSGSFIPRRGFMGQLFLTQRKGAARAEVMALFGPLRRRTVEEMGVKIRPALRGRYENASLLFEIAQQMSSFYRIRRETAFLPW